jgi:hypothetical protein
MHRCPDYSTNVCAIYGSANNHSTNAGTNNHAAKFIANDCP